MKAAQLPLAQKIVILSLYTSLILLYCALYAPAGLENNDSGFIIGLAHQFYDGARIYEDIVYVRPPASIILHSVNFIIPFDAPAIISSRIFYFTQIGIYSAVIAILFSRQLGMNAASSLILASLCFIFNAHNFPPMAWHTVDGVFFSVLALALAAIAQNGSVSALFFKSFLAFSLAIAAALSKQPFYITPILVGLVLVYPLAVRQMVIAGLAAISSAAILRVSLETLLDTSMMLDAISSQTSIRDLVSAGVVDYARDWYSRRSIVTAGPLAVVLFIWTLERVKGASILKRTHLQICLIFSVAIYLASILQVFLTADRWVSTASMLDSIFTITLFISIIETFRTRDRIWLVLTAMHGISWSASISWGYTTASLFSAPSIVVVAAACIDIFKKGYLQIAIAAFAPVVAAAIFFAGNQFLYSLEGPVRRSDLTVSPGAEFPALAGLRITTTQAKALQELQILRSRLGENVVVLPNWPLYNVIFGGTNRIGIDWLLNTEVGPFDQIVRSRLDQVEFALVFRNASPDPSSEGRFGSQITQSVMANWVSEDQGGKYFQVYSNPLLK